MEQVAEKTSCPIPVNWVPSLWPVVSAVRENGDTVTLTVTIPIEARPTGAQPGQFYMLYRFGVGEIPISISAIHQDRLCFTIRKVGAVSTALANLKVGDVVGVRGPFGRGWPAIHPDFETLILVAGGVGLAPLRPVIHAAIATSKLKAVHILYGGRSPETLLFVNEIALWRQQGISCSITVDSAPLGWVGSVGVVTALLDALTFEPKHALAMVCGPEVMMRFSASKLIACGLSPSQIYLSMERNMKCAVGVCGHCQYGKYFMCKDGPVFHYEELSPYLRIKEL